MLRPCRSSPYRPNVSPTQAMSDREREVLEHDEAHLGELERLA
jgi:hypothetical protein